MKFKKYIKESAEPVVKHTLIINEDFTNPDAPSYASDELYRLYRPIEKMIEEGRYEEAKAELDELSADLDALEERNKTKRFFKYPQYIIDAQRKNIASYRDKLPKNESIDDMDNRCEKCNTLLTDAGECPKCDLGEEDYGDEIKEELSNKEKLKKTYPELNFEDEPVTEELSNKEKLKKAFPELNFDKEHLTEGAGADSRDAAAQALSEVAQGDKNKWAATVSKILEMIPDKYADQLFDSTVANCSGVEVDNATKQKIVNDIDEDVVTEESVEEAKTVGDIFSVMNAEEWADKNPSEVKKLAVSILDAICKKNPHPVLLVILAVVRILPEEIVAKIFKFALRVSNPTAAGKAVLDAVAQNESLTNAQKLKAAYPELNIDVDDTVEESWDEYDDEYDIDDVEMDRRHAALYGGDRMYCDCGTMLKYDEYGSYCPDCEPKDPEDAYDD